MSTPIEELQQSGPILAVIADEYFRTIAGLDPLELDVHVGLYLAYDRAGRRPKEIVVGSNRLAMRYLLHIDKRPLAFAAAPPPIPGTPESETQAEGGPRGRIGSPWSYDPSTYRPVSGPADATQDGIMHMPIKGDAVHDDEAELDRAGGGWNLHTLGEDLRRELFGGNLDRITERPFTIPAKLGQQAATGRAFLASLARDFTYDEKGNYFEKWRDNQVAPARRYERLTAAYLARWWEEVILLEKRLHLWVTDASGGVLWELGELGKKLAPRVVMGDPSKLRTRYEQNVAARKESAAGGGKPPARLRALFFFAADGASAQFQLRTPRTYTLDKEARATHMIVDPKRMVTEACGGTLIGEHLGIADEFEWLVELVAQKFPARFYVVNLRRFGDRWRDGTIAPQDAPQGLRKEFYLASRVALMKEPGGPLVEAARAQLDAWLDQPHLLVLPQGLDVGDGRKFIGLDQEGLAYVWNTKTSHLEATPEDELLMHLARRQLYRGVARDCAWITPVATFLAYSALTVVSLGTASSVTAGELTAQGVRTWALRNAVYHGINHALWEGAKKLAPHFAAAVALLLLRLFDDPKAPNTAAARWKGFAKGFFEGYVIQTLYDHLYKRIELTLTEGPKEVRVIKGMLKVYAAIDRVHGIIKRVDDELTEAAQVQARKHFQGMVLHIVRGCALIIAGLHHVPHDEAAPILDLLGRGPDEVPPDRKHWEAESGAGIAQLNRGIAEALATATSVTDVLEDVAGTGKQLVLAGGVLYAFTDQSKEIGLAAGKFVWKRKKLFLFTSISAVGLMAGMNPKDVPRFIDDIGGLLKDVGTAAANLISEAVGGFPGRDPAQAELYGKIVGNLLGGLVLDRWLGKAKPHILPSHGQDKVLESMFDNNFEHGVIMPIIKLIFKRYLSLYDRLVKKDVLGASEGHGRLAELFDDAHKAAIARRGLSPLLLELEPRHAKGVSIQRLAMVAIKLHGVLREDTKRYLKEKYGSDIEHYKRDLAAGAKLLGNLGLTGLVEENLEISFHSLATHLRLGLGEIIEGLRLMFTPFKEGGRFSWITLLAELGLDVGSISGLRKELLEPRKQELATFGITGPAGGEK